MCFHIGQNKTHCTRVSHVDGSDGVPAQMTRGVDRPALSTVWRHPTHPIPSEATLVQLHGHVDQMHSTCHPVPDTDLVRGTGNSTRNLSTWIDERLRKCGFVPPSTGAVHRPISRRCRACRLWSGWQLSVLPCVTHHFSRLRVPCPTVDQYL